MSGGSRFEQWLERTMKAPSRGMLSTPSTRSPNSRRPSPPAIVQPGWKNQLFTDGLQVLDDRIDARVDVQLAGVEHERPRRDAQRSHRAAGIGRVAAPDVL